MAEQYYDVRTKKVLSVRERVGGEVVFDHGRLSEQIFQQDLDRGVLVRYTPEARKPAHGQSDTPFVNAFLMSGLAAFTFSKLFDRDKTPRLMVDDVNHQIKANNAIAAKSFLNEYRPDLNPKIQALVEEGIHQYIQSKGGRGITLTGPGWMRNLHELHGFLIKNNPNLSKESKKELESFFKGIVRKTHQQLFGDQAPKGFADAVLKSGSGLATRFEGRKQYMSALTPLVNSRLNALQDMATLDEQSGKIAKASNALFNYRSKLTADRAEIQSLQKRMARAKLEHAKNLTTVQKRGGSATRIGALQAEHLDYLARTQAEIQRLEQGIRQSTLDFRRHRVSYAQISHGLNKLPKKTPALLNAQAKLAYLDKMVDSMLATSQTDLMGDATRYRQLNRLLGRYATSKSPQEIRRLEGLLHTEYGDLLNRDDLPFAKDLRRSMADTNAELGWLDGKDGDGRRGKASDSPFQPDVYDDELVDQFKETSRGLEKDLSRRDYENAHLLRADTPIDRAALDEKVGQYLYDEQSGRNLLVVGRVGDRLRVVDPAMEEGFENRSWLADATVGKENQGLIRSNLSLLAEGSVDHREKAAIARLSSMLTDPAARQKEVARRLAGLEGEAGSREVLHDRALLSIFDDIAQTLSPNSRVGSLKGLLHDFNEAEARPGQTVMDLLLHGIPQHRVKANVKGQAGAMLQRILKSARAVEGGYSVILSNHSMFGKALDSLQFLEENGVGVRDQIYQILGRSTGVSDRAALSAVQAHLANVFAARDKRLYNAFASHSGLGLASDLVTWYDQQRTSLHSLDAPNGTDTDLSLLDTVHAPDGRTWYEHDLDDERLLRQTYNQRLEARDVVESRLTKLRRQRGRLQQLQRGARLRKARLAANDPRIQRLGEKLKSVEHRQATLKEQRLTFQNTASRLQERADRLEDRITNVTDLGNPFVPRARRSFRGMAHVQSGVASLARERSANRSLRGYVLGRWDRQYDRLSERAAFYGSQLPSLDRSISRASRQAIRLNRILQAQIKQKAVLSPAEQRIERVGEQIDRRIEANLRTRGRLESEMSEIQKQLGIDLDDLERWSHLPLPKRDIGMVDRLRGYVHGGREALLAQLKDPTLTAEQRASIVDELHRAGLTPDEREKLERRIAHYDERLEEAKGKLREFHINRGEILSEEDMNEYSRLIGHVRSLGESKARWEDYRDMPYQLLKDMEGDAHKARVDEVMGHLTSVGGISPEGRQGLRQVLHNSPAVLNAVIEGKTRLLPARQESREARGFLQGTKFHYRFLDVTSRNDPFMSSNPMGGYQIESTARAALAMQQRNPNRKAVILDLETALGNTSDFLAKESGPLGPRNRAVRPAITELAYAEQMLQDLMGVGENGYATLKANMKQTARSFFVRPREDVRATMLDLFDRQAQGLLEGKENAHLRQNLEFLQKRYGIATIGGERRVGILALSPEGHEDLGRTNFHNLFLYEDDKGQLKHAYVQHDTEEREVIENGVKRTETFGKKGHVKVVSLDKDSPVRKQLQKTVGYDFKNGQLRLAQHQVVTEDQLAKEMVSLFSRMKGGDVLVGSNLLRHDLPIILTLVRHNTNLANDAEVREGIEHLLKGVNYFDIAVAMRSLGHTRGSVQAAVERYITDEEHRKQLHVALDDVFKEAFVGARLAQDMAAEKAVKTVTSGQYLLDEKTGHLIEVTGLQHQGHETSQLYGRYTSSASLYGRNRELSIANELAETDRTITINGQAHTIRRQIRRPLAMTMPERFSVVESLDQLSDHQKRFIRQQEIQRLTDGEYLARALANAQNPATRWQAPEFMADLRGFVERLATSHAAGAGDLPSHLLSGIVQAMATPETRSIYRLGQQPKKYAAWMSRDLEASLKRLGRGLEGRKSANRLVSLVLRSARGELDGELREHLEKQMGANAFDENVRAILLGENWAQGFKNLNGERDVHFRPAHTEPVKTLALSPEDLKSLTPAKFQRLIAPDTTSFTIRGNALREILYEGDQRPMREIIQAELAEQIAASRSTSNVDLDAGLQRFMDSYAKHEDRYLEILNHQYATDEALQRSVRASVELEKGAFTPEAAQEFLRRRASASVAASQIRQDLEALKETNYKQYENFKAIVDLEAEGRTINEQTMQRIVENRLVAAQENVLGGLEGSQEAITDALTQLRRSYGFGVAEATNARTLSVHAAQWNETTARFFENLSPQAPVRISAEAVASPGYREEMSAYAREVAQDPRRSNRFAELQAHIESVFGAGPATDRKIAETPEDAIKSMTSEQLDALYARTHADRAKVFDLNNTFLGYVPRQDLPEVAATQSWVARVGKSRHVGGFQLEVGVADGTVEAQTMQGMDRAASALRAQTPVSAVRNEKIPFQHVAPPAAQSAEAAQQKASETLKQTIETVSQQAVEHGETAKRQLLSKESLGLLKIGGGVALGLLGMSLLSKPTFDEKNDQYLPSQELQPPPETFYGHQLETFKDYKKSRAKDLQREQQKEKQAKYERGLEAKGVQNYKINIKGDAMGGKYDPAAAESTIRGVLQQNVSQPLNMQVDRDDQRRDLYDATYQTALRSYLDR